MFVNATPVVAKPAPGVARNRISATTFEPGAKVTPVPMSRPSWKPTRPAASAAGEEFTEKVAFKLLDAEPRTACTKFNWFVSNWRLTPMAFSRPVDSSTMRTRFVWPRATFIVSARTTRDAPA